MKHFICLLTLLTFPTSSSSRESASTKNVSFLQMQGIVKLTGNHPNEIAVPLDSLQVIIFDPDHRELNVYYSERSGKCDFRLPLNRKFMLFFSKKDFVTKIIEVDTDVPEKWKKCYAFYFDIEIFKQIKGLDVSLLSQPVAKVFFDPDIHGFNYNAEYTSEVNDRLKKMYAEYYSLHAKQDSLKNVSASPPAEKTGIQPKDSISTGPGILPTAENSKTVITYKVQICSVVFGPLPIDAPVFKESGKPDEYYSDGMFKYTIGEFGTEESAQLMLIKLQQKGYPDAFIVVFSNGKRVAEIVTKKEVLQK